uniref:Alpha-1,3-glucosyltransferase n=1 Tax=Rhodotorula toruloides TaxID=5286 RepID=A0A0K3CD36_RHOTO
MSSTTSRRSKPPPYEPPEPPKPPARWWQLDRAERDLLALSTASKLLLFPAYRSTDFEVHRNWLAVTHSLPLSRWYYDTTSEWTLDYPPFFAFFERFLSSFAYIVDPDIVRLDNLGYTGGAVVAFQRTTVILSELVLALALFRWARTSQKPDYPTASVIAASVLFHPGLLIVDHIHFQYNGFLLGILLWSLIAARDNNLYACAALFATLLNFKHIFVYLALPYFVFLLRRHCYPPGGKFQIDRVVELGIIVASICTLSFGPCVVAGGFSQLRQIFSRLFPFQRGLNHAYWAGNVWAIVSAVDRVLVKYLVARGWPISTEALTSSSRGLIGSTTFGVLPNITPRHTFALTFGFTSVFLVKLWFDPSYKRFLNSVVLAAMTSFLWGWHVHEKAVLLFLVPLSLTATDDDNHYRAFLIATTAGIYGLFPLLIKPAGTTLLLPCIAGLAHALWPAETPIKILVTLLWSAFVLPQLRKVVYRPLPNLFTMLIDKAETLYLYGFVFVQIYTTFLHSFLFPSAPAASSVPGVIICSASAVANGTCVDPAVAQQAMEVSEASMEFLPLMLTSVYCAVGIVWSWLRLSWGFLTS